MSRPAVVIRMDAARTNGDAICITYPQAPMDDGVAPMSLVQAETLLADLTDAIAFVRALKTDKT